MPFNIGKSLCTYLNMLWYHCNRDFRNGRYWKAQNPHRANTFLVVSNESRKFTETQKTTQRERERETNKQIVLSSCFPHQELKIELTSSSHSQASTRVSHNDIQCNSMRMPSNMQTSFNCSSCRHQPQQTAHTTMHAVFTFIKTKRDPGLAASLQLTPVLTSCPWSSWPDCMV